MQDGEIVPHLEITEVVLVHYNMVNNNYQHDSIVLYTFIPSKSFISLLDTSPKIFHISETFNSEFSLNGLLFTNQNSKPQVIK